MANKQVGFGPRRHRRQPFQELQRAASTPASPTRQRSRSWAGDSAPVLRRDQDPP
jgi:hypothetical protein